MGAEGNKRLIFARAASQEVARLEDGPHKELDNLIQRSGSEISFKVGTKMMTLAQVVDLARSYGRMQGLAEGAALEQNEPAQRARDSIVSVRRTWTVGYVPDAPYVLTEGLPD